MPVNVPYSQSMRRSTSHNYNTPRYHGPSSPKIDLLPADSRASDSQDMQGQGCMCVHVKICCMTCPFGHIVQVQLQHSYLEHSGARSVASNLAHVI